MIISAESHKTHVLSEHSYAQLEEAIKEHQQLSEHYFTVFTSPRDPFFYIAQQHIDFARLLKRLLSSKRLDVFPLQAIERQAQVLVNLSCMHPI